MSPERSVSDRKPSPTAQWWGDPQIEKSLPDPGLNERSVNWDRARASELTLAILFAPPGIINKLGAIRM